jgi:hypothetical protein
MLQTAERGTRQPMTAWRLSALSCQLGLLGLNCDTVDNIRDHTNRDQKPL